jgi:hypothetical protein
LSDARHCFRYAAGDLIAQSFEKDPTKGYDWERAAVFMAFGTILAGPVYARRRAAAAASAAHSRLQVYRLVRQN